jgi:phage N-6-adenine-methyltransferase
MGATLNRGRSRQDYQTPKELMMAIYHRFGIPGFTLDAAASVGNAQADRFYTAEDNGLVHPWATWTWCNPPFGHIAPWVEKAWTESLLTASSMLLVPASVGSNWWRDWVHNKAHVVFLNGRITFVGATDPYPKDCALLIYAPTTTGGYSIWSWQ